MPAESELEGGGAAAEPVVLPAVAVGSPTVGRPVSRSSKTVTAGHVTAGHVVNGTVTGTPVNRGGSMGDGGLGAPGLGELPAGWAMAFDAEQRPYYINYNLDPPSTSYEHPVAGAAVPRDSGANRVLRSALATL